MKKKTTSGSIIEQVKCYMETKLKLLKYEAVDKAGSIAAELIADVAVFMFLLLLFFFLSITLALFAAYLLHSGWKGFGCVTLLYGIIALFAKALKSSLQNIFVRISVSKVSKHK